jgi:hypothetical protein
MDVVQDTLFEAGAFATRATLGYDPDGHICFAEIRCQGPEGTLICLESKGWSSDPSPTEAVAWIVAHLDQHASRHAEPF